jgi:hypothetical protein
LRGDDNTDGWPRYLGENAKDMLDDLHWWAAALKAARSSGR